MVCVERAGLPHLDALADLFDDYRQFYERTSDAAGARRFLGARLDRGESVVFLASLDDGPVGFTQLYPWFSSLGMSRVWILNDLFVVPTARRRGVASALLDAARRHGEETGASSLALQTTVDNAAAQALYERQGWTRDRGFYWYSLGLDGED